MPYGIVEQINSSSYIVNKCLYSVRLYTNESLNIGDIIKTHSYSYNTYINDIQKNILFTCNSFDVVGNFYIKQVIYDYISHFDNVISSILLKQFYNTYSETNIYFNIGYGLTIFIIFNFISKKNPYICTALIFLYSLLFCFQIRFILILIDCIFHKQKSINRLTIKLLFISFVNINIIKNYSILIPLVYNLYFLINFKMDYKLFISLFSSFLFGEINLIYILIFKYLKYLRVLFFFICILFLIFPIFSNVFVTLINSYTKLNDILSISLRGQITLTGIIIYFLIINILNIKNYNIKFIVYIIILLCPINLPYFTIKYINVGQGDAILINDVLKNKNILIDTGSKYNYSKLKTQLFKNSIYKIDYLIITHDDEDHCGNIDNLKKDFIIEEIIYEGHDIDLLKGKLEYLYLGEYDNDNDNSLVYILNINDIKFLFTGDISKNIELKLLKEYGPLNIDFLKVSHHGSDSASGDYFVSKINAKYAIISTSGQYNHPAKEVVDILNKYNVKILNTKYEGNISIILSKFFNIIYCQNGNVIIM